MKENSPFIEKKLVDKLKKGNMIAFDHLFHLYSNRLFYFAKGYLKSDADAEEIVQEVFAKIWEKRSSLKEKLSFKAYLFTIAFNAIQKFFIKKSRQQEYCNNSQGTSPEEDHSTIELIDYHSLLGFVDQLIEELPPRRKEVFLKSRKEGLSTKEIANQMKISPKTVENQLTEALKYLKKNLGQENLSRILFFALFLQ